MIIKYTDTSQINKDLYYAILSKSVDGEYNTGGVALGEHILKTQSDEKMSNKFLTEIPADKVMDIIMGL